MFCCKLLYVLSSIAIILMGKRELVALLGLSSWCLVVVERLFLAVPGGCLRFVIVAFPDHTHLLFLNRGLMLWQLSDPLGFTCWISLAQVFSSCTVTVESLSLLFLILCTVESLCLLYLHFIS